MKQIKSFATHTALASAMALALSSPVALATEAHTSLDKESAPVLVSGATGAAMGGMVAGPVGAVVGGIFGLMIGQDAEQERIITVARQNEAQTQQQLFALQDELVEWQHKAMVQPVTIIESAEPLLPELTTTIQFKTGQDTIEPIYDEQLSLVADLLNGADELGIHISGYADPRGSHKDNLALSEKRAIAVKQTLLDSGVNAEQITISANGERGEVLNPSFESYFFDRKAVLMIAPRDKILTAQRAN